MDVGDVGGAVDSGCVAFVLMTLGVAHTLLSKPKFGNLQHIEAYQLVCVEAEIIAWRRVLDFEDNITLRYDNLETLVNRLDGLQAMSVSLDAWVHELWVRYYYANSRTRSVFVSTDNDVPG